MKAKLAIDGGEPVRRDALPFFRVSYGDEERREVEEVFQSGIFGSVYPEARKVRELEQAFAEYAGAHHAVAFSSGTTAQHAALVAAGVGPGDQVVVPPLTFASTAYTVLMVGATPVFADVDDQTITLDPARVAEVITPRTRAIVPVHWFGHPAAMDELLELADRHDLRVIEDCAHAYGASYRGLPAGTIGDMACWSLQQSKVLTAAGEGGMLTTDDDHYAEVARSVCDHGKDKSGDAGVEGYRIVRLGNNYRLSEMHAAFALAQLRRVGSFEDARAAHAARLDESLAEIPGLRIPSAWPDVQAGRAYYPVRFSEDRFSVGLHRLADALEAEGIETIRIADDEFCPDHPLFRESSPPADVPVAERIRRELLLLPLYPDLEAADIGDIVAAVGKVAGAYAVG